MFRWVTHFEPNRSEAGHEYVPRWINCEKISKDIADKLIKSVMTSLEGKKIESMTSVTSMVRKELDEALIRILTPRQIKGILDEISANKGK